MANNNHAIIDVMTVANLKLYAGSTIYRRGEDYFKGGLVRSLVIDGDKAAAKVHGSSIYSCKVVKEGAGFEGQCDCPYFEDNDFCKHLVAMGLKIIDSQNEDSRKEKIDANDPRVQVLGKRKSQKDVVTLYDIKRYLAALDKAGLVKIISEQAMNDDGLLRRLRVEASKKLSKGIDVEAIKNAIDHATYIDDFDQGLRSVISTIADLLKSDFYSETMELTEYFLASIESCMENLDDSDGHMSDIFDTLQELHLKACEKARPDPKELAGKLFEWELRTQWDVFYCSVKTYAKVLGKTGIEEFRKLATSYWEKIPALGTKATHDYDDGLRYKITRIMEALAGVSGSIDELIEIKKKDLSTSYSYLNIAEVYRSNKRFGEALEWAEKGYNAFKKERSDSRLLTFLAEEYHRVKRHQEAMSLIWKIFEESRTVHEYTLLKNHANITKGWDVWREKAVNLLADECKARKSQKTQAWGGYNHAASTLIEIYLKERNEDSAWNIAHEYGCGQELWIRLAKLKVNEKPEDVINIYKKIVDSTVNMTGNDAYRDALGHVKTIRQIYNQIGKEDEFQTYLGNLRVKFKPKRNFIKLLSGRI